MEILIINLLEVIRLCVHELSLRVFLIDSTLDSMTVTSASSFKSTGTGVITCKSLQAFALIQFNQLQVQFKPRVIDFSIMIGISKTLEPYSLIQLVS